MAKSPNDDLAPATRLVTTGRRPEWTTAPDTPGGAVSPPIWRASTHLYADTADLVRGRANRDGAFYYGRRGSPTQWSLAEALTELEPGAAGTTLYPSGVAALAGAVLAVAKTGQQVLITDNAYDPTRTLGAKLLAPLGISHAFFDPADPADLAAKLDDNTAAVILESPGSLTMEVQDIPALSALARARGAAVIVDNTWATGLGFHAISHGADLSVVSLTKHVGGHSDLMMGAVTANESWAGKVRVHSQVLGQVVSPDDAALALRGLRTMAVRLERATASALAIARWLEDRPEVARVLCPMLPGSPGHEIWERDFTGGCGLFSFVFRGGDTAARARFIDSLTLFGIGFSWGGFESLVIPNDPGHYRSVVPWPHLTGPEDKLAVRLSIGLEDAGDLIADLEGGFAAWNDDRS